MYPDGQLLRFLHPLTGVALLTQEEADAHNSQLLKQKEQERQRADAESARAKEERQRAEQEATHANEERERADKEAARANRAEEELARLRELLAQQPPQQ